MPRDDASPAARWLAPWLWIVVAAFSLWLRTAFPVQAFPFAVHDDALFLRLARALMSGRWLGNYDNLTLAKGMFFPLFIGVAGALAIPLKIAEQVAYLGVSWAAGRFVGRRAGEPRLGFALFVALAFNPALWDIELSRVIREGIYLTLCLALLCTVAALSFPSPAASARARLRVGLAAGAVGAAFWLTREEGIWLGPSVALLLGIGLARVALGPARGVPGARRLALRAILVPAAAGTALALALVLAVMAANYARYGAFVTVEFHAAAFHRGYGALARIEHDERRPHVVFPRDARLRAYAVSPAARELEPALEGQVSQSWRSAGCGQLAIPDQDCPEILSGWFMWALRDAVSVAGHATSADSAMAFYDRLAREINEACDAGRIRCGPPRATLAPAFDPASIPASIEAARKLLPIMLGLGDRPPSAPASRGSQLDVFRMADSVGRAAPVQRDLFFFRGWIEDPGTPELIVRRRPGVPEGPPPGADVLLAIRALPDAGPDLRQFSLEANCARSTCEFIARRSDGTVLVRPLDDLRAGYLTEGDVRMHLDEVSHRTFDGTSEARRVLQLPVVRAISATARLAMPWLFVLGTLGLVIAAIRRSPAGIPLVLWSLAVASLGAVASRTVLLAYLDATSIPSVSVLYASPASPFVIIVAVLGIYTAFAPMRARGRAAR